MAVSSIEEYLDSLHDTGRCAVEEWMKFMQEHYPSLPCRISFSMPMWMFGKKMKDGYVAVSAANNHLSIHFSDEAFLNSIHHQLPQCKTGKRCINVKYEDEQSMHAVKEAVICFLQHNLK